MKYYLVSGGRDSTAMVLLAYEQGKKGILVYGDTRINRSGGIETVKRLAELTKWKLNVVRYEGEKKVIQVLRESFLKIPKALEHIQDKGVYRRNTFECCHILKHKPMNDFIKGLSKQDDPILVLGIKGYEGAIHRRYRMRQIREQNTFYRRHKNGLLYYYPLRDMTDKDVDEILSRHGFQDTKHSGCTICPIFCLFENWKNRDGDTWRRSVQFADRLGILHPATGQVFFHNCEYKETLE